VNSGKVLRILGLSLVLLGIVINRYSLAIFSSDGQIVSPLFNGLILLFQVSAVASGVYLSLRPEKSTVINLTILGLTLGAMFLILEMGVRVMLFGSAAFSYPAMRSTAEFGNSDLLQVSDVPGMVFDLKPNHHTRYALQDWRTNKEGMRDVARSLRKPENTIRVAVLGDSFTAPTGVALDASYHKRLERYCNEAYPEWHFEFLNFAVPGYQLPQYLAVMVHKIPVYDPDFYLLGFCAENDHLDMPESYYADPFVIPPRRNGFWSSFLVRLIIRLNHLPAAALDKSLHPEYAEFVDRHFEMIARASRGKPLLVAYLGNLPRPGEEVAPVAAAHGFHFLDTSKRFAGKNLREYSIYHPIDSHPNDKANALFAEDIFAFLQEEGILQSLIEARQSGLESEYDNVGSKQPDTL